MNEQIHDKRQPKFRWPGERVPCPKCGGARTVYYTQQHAHDPGDVIGGKRVICSACGGKGKVREPRQVGELTNPRP